jgi:hypothetical protein
MAVTYGFYNSISNDRKYDALQFSSIFDGIILDGILMSIGGQLRVSPTGGRSVEVATGRAWFNHTWTLNDAIITLNIDTTDHILHRIDAIVIEINTADATRANSIKLIKGTPSVAPVHPVMENTATLHQYPLAYIDVPLADADPISADQITNCVGTVDCPFVTGPLQTINASYLLSQWGAQFNLWLDARKAEYNTELLTPWTILFNDWFDGVKAQFVSDENAKLAEVSNWLGDAQSQFSAEELTRTNDWIAWFTAMQNQLTTDAAGNLQTQIDSLNTKVRVLTGPLTYYVRADGNNNNNGLADTSAGAFLTIQKAVDMVAATDIGANDVYIFVGDGTYSTGATLKPYRGSGTVYIIGNGTNPSYVFILCASSGPCFRSADTPNGCGNWNITGMKFQTTNFGSCIYITGNIHVTLGNVIFARAAESHMRVEYGARLSIETPGYWINGNAGTSHIYVANRGTFEVAWGITVTFMGSPTTIPYFVVANTYALVAVGGITFASPGFMVGQKFVARQLSIINSGVGGLSYLPGTIAGVIESGTGSIYL